MHATPTTPAAGSGPRSTRMHRLIAAPGVAALVLIGTAASALRGPEVEAVTVAGPQAGDDLQTGQLDAYLTEVYSAVVDVLAEPDASLIEVYSMAVGLRAGSGS